MASVHTLSSLAASSTSTTTRTSSPAPARASASAPTLAPAPAPAPALAGPLRLFPTTRDHEKSAFKDIQSGPSRTLMPTFTSLQEERQYRKEHLVLVFRALHRQGLAEGVAGHCSTRDPIEPNTFWVNPQGRSFARMRVSDLVRVSDSGEIVQGDQPVDASATSIHAPIYKAMGRGPAQPGGSDGGCEAIVHVHGPHSKGTSPLLFSKLPSPTPLFSPRRQLPLKPHSQYLSHPPLLLRVTLPLGHASDPATAGTLELTFTAFSALGRQLDRVNQDVCAFDGCTVLVPFGGAVFDDLEGKRIGSFLRPDTKVALLQNHGPLSIGKLSIDEAAWWQLNYEMCCKSQLLLDAATHRPSAAMAPNVVRVGDVECASTKEEIGSSEMGWFCFGPYIEDELSAAKGDHLL